MAKALSNFYPVPLERIGIAETFTETSLSHDELLDYYEMEVNDIVKATQSIIKKKK